MSLSRKQNRAKKAQLRKTGGAQFTPEKLQNALGEAARLFQAGDSTEAASLCVRLIKAVPSNAEAYHLLGVITNQQGDVGKAILYINKAIAISPQVPSYYNNLGNVLVANEDLPGALAAFEKAVQMQPNYPAAINNIGIILGEMGRLEEEIENYKMGLDVDPTDGHLINELVKALSSACSWDELLKYKTRLLDITTNQLQQHSPTSLTPYHALTLDVDADFKKRVAQNYALNNFANIPPAFKHDRGCGDKIRVGYVSADFRDHPTAHLIGGLFKLHDKDKIEVFAYSYGPNDHSTYRKEIENNCDNFKDVFRWDIKLIAQQIYDDKIDILVDVMGYIQNAIPTLFALRPAPVQVSYLAYPGTMGAPFIDYLITDRVAIPAEQEKHYVEKLLFMPHTYFITDDTQPISLSPSRAECGLPEDKFVFCCFNKTNKIDTQVFDCWMDILSQVPDSVLWLLSDNEFVQNNLKKEAVARGIKGERLVFAGRLPKDQHLARHANADLFLDCFTVNAHTTAIDALWAGLPVITKIGNDVMSRASASIINAVDLPELITNTNNEYITLAVKYATDIKACEELKEKLIGNVATQALFDTAQYVQDFEEILISIVKK